MGTEEIIETLRKKFERVSEVLDERGRRCGLLRSGSLGCGEQSIMAKATGLARITLYREGLRQVSDQRPYPQERIRNQAGTDDVVSIGSFSGAHYQRRSGKSATMDLLEYPSVVRSPSKARVSDRPSNSATLLEESGYSLQGNQKTKEGSSHPDRMPSSDIFTAV